MKNVLARLFVLLFLIPSYAVAGLQICPRMPVATAVSNQFLTSISASGATTLAQPAFSNLSGSVAASQMPALTGDITTSAGAVATTLATVNSNVGTFGSATQVAQVTVNGKGLVTAASNVTITAPPATYAAKTTTYTTTASDNVVKFDMSGSSNANYIATLHTAVGNTGQILTLITSAGTGILTLNTTSSQTIGGFASGGLKLQYVNSQIQVVSDGTNWQILNFHRPPTYQIFISGSSATYTTAIGAQYIKVRMVGPGGGGGGSSDGSGNGGNGGAASADATFGNLTAGKGAAGPGSTSGSASGGAGGTATVGSGWTEVKSWPGGVGGGSSDNSITAAFYRPQGGIGGGTCFGSGTQSSAAGAQAAVTNAGVGGSGAGVATAGSSRVGGGGGGGACIEAIAYNPAATYTYSAPAGGAAGSAGTNGNAGTAGATSLIIVEEHY